MSPESAERPESGGFEVRLTPKDLPGEERVFVFRQSKVIVGRSSACDLRLDDPERLASSRHAQISLEGGRLEVMDLASRNSTFLNGERLEPRRAYELGPDDEIVIAGTKLLARPLVVAPSDGEGTMLAPGALNPFAHDARLLAEVLGKMADTYEQSAPEGRTEKLAEALGEALGDASGDAYVEIGRLLSRSDDESDR